MKALRPSRIVLLGTLLLAPLFALALLAIGGGSHDLPSLLWAMGCGVGVGLGVFGPIAAMLLLGERWPGWMLRHACQIGFYSSLAMALSMGYLVACFHHKLRTPSLLVAMGLVYLGAAVKGGLHYALREAGKDNAR